MILLNKEDIRKVYSMKDAIEGNKECYALDAQGKFVVPLRPVIQAEKGNFIFMPSYSSDMNAAACKIVNIFPGNGAIGLPGLIG